MQVYVNVLFTTGRNVASFNTLYLITLGKPAAIAIGGERCSVDCYETDVCLPRACSTLVLDGSMTLLRCCRACSQSLPC